MLAGSGEDRHGQDQGREGSGENREYTTSDAAEEARGHEDRQGAGIQDTPAEEKICAITQVIAALCEYDDVKIKLPNGGDLRNITSFIRNLDSSQPEKLEFELNKRWVFVHPAVLAFTACAAELVHSQGGTIEGVVPNISSLPYLVRMKLFDYVRLPPPISILEHEEAGRFIPLTQIKTSEDLRNAIANLVPLLHAEKEVADPIKYVFSEMVRNALEHSNSPVGAFVAAQYYRQSQRIAIGIADAGIGVYEHMRQFHNVKNSRDAIALALQPGITGTTGRVGGTARNAGAGLFFTKNIASVSRNLFVLYSGDAAYRLMQGPVNRVVKLDSDPLRDPHKFPVGLPNWKGTVVGIDITVSPEVEFADLLDQVRKVYYLDVKRKKDYSQKIKFT